MLFELLEKLRGLGGGEIGGPRGGREQRGGEKGEQERAGVKEGAFSAPSAGLEGQDREEGQGRQAHN